MRRPVRSSSALLFVGVSALAGASSLSAQIDWLARTPAASPTPRVQHVLGYDAIRERAVLFGGQRPSGMLIADTWTFDGFTWVNLSPASAPGPRWLSSVASDEARGHVVLFGGLGNSSLLADTWEWVGNNWLRMLPVHVPPARANHAMDWHPSTSSTLMFGGEGAGGVLLDDTWVWDGTDWTLETPTSRPSARANTALARDDNAGQLVLFGGNGAGGLLGDTWTWDGTDWTLQSPATSPSPRWLHDMVWDAERQVVVLFGGEDAGGTPLDETWEWDGTTWTQVTTLGAPPAGGRDQMVFQTLWRRVLLLGSSTDTWELLDVPSAEVVPYGAGCSTSSGSTSGLDATPGSRPLIGTQLDLDVSGMPGSALGLVYVGFSRDQWLGTPLPLDLTPFGASGCSVLAWPVIVTPPLAPGVGGIAQFGFPLPADSNLVGQSLFAQGAVLDVGANPFGVATTNGAQLKLSDR